MVQVLEVIKMKGGAQVELLATPALFAIAKRKGWKIEADPTNMSDVYATYSKLIYLAALNAWEVRRYDAPEIGEFSYTLMDFVEWCSEDAERFAKIVRFIVFGLTGKDMADIQEAPEAEPAKQEVKKKSKSKWITRLFRRS